MAETGTGSRRRGTPELVRPAAHGGGSSSSPWGSWHHGGGRRRRLQDLDARAGQSSAVRGAWRDYLVQGAAQGAILAMIALGYSLVYGILRMINFAHGEVFMAGAFGSFFFADAYARAGS